MSGGVDRPVMGKWGLSGDGILVMIMMNDDDDSDDNDEDNDEMTLRHPPHHKTNWNTDK